MIQIHGTTQNSEFSHDYFNAFFKAVNIKISLHKGSPFLLVFWTYVLLCFVLSGGFASLFLGVLNPHTVGPLTNPALLLSPPRRRLCLQRHTQVVCPHPALHLALLPPSCHCVPDKLQNNEFLADDDVALSPRSEPTPVMPGIRESAFRRLL